MIQINAEEVSTFTAVIVAVGGLITAIKAHGKATGATDTANTSQALSQALIDLGRTVITLFGNTQHSSAAAPTVVLPPGYTQATNSPTSPIVISNDAHPEAVLNDLIQWLTAQHKATTGQEPGGPATTDFSKVLNQIGQLEDKIR